MTGNKVDPTGIVYSPPEAAKLAIDALEEIKKESGKGVKTGIKDLDNVLLPCRPGELIVVLGYTSNYKSSFANFLIKSALKQREEDEIVIKVTWEDSIEEDTIKWIASDAGLSISGLIKGNHDDWYTAVMRSYAARAVAPLWMVGHSNQLSEKFNTSRPRMTMTDVSMAIDYIRHKATDNQYRPKLVVLDYLQRMRPDHSDGDSKREQMMEAVNKAKDLGIAMGCPVLLLVQAKREVMDRSFKLPRIDDGQETSNIEQSADKVISLWYPIKSEPEETVIESINVKVTKNLLICGILKQKMGPSPVVMPLWVDPEKNIIASVKKDEK